MWTIKDFYKILDLLRNNNRSDLSDSLVSNALDEKSTATDFFEKTLNQYSFNNNNYNRLRDYLIEWYASLKTMTAVQRNINDVYGLPDSHVDEAFRSKGFNLSVLLSKYGTGVNYNKVNFYYDLVNLYKKKGTPNTLLNVLRYFGFPNIEILEYMTYRRKSTNKVEFHSLSADHTGLWWSTNTDILTYDEATSWDPHYLTSEKSIIYGQDKSHLHLPSKSPYFTLRHFINISEFSKLSMFLSRKVQDQYREWKPIYENIQSKPDYDPTKHYQILPKELYIDSCTMDVSVVELFLACTYTYRKHYGTKKTFTNVVYPNESFTQSLGNGGDNFNCYDGTSSEYIEIVNQFNDYLENVPLTRDEVKANHQHYMDLFIRTEPEDFLQNIDTAGEVLRLMNPELMSRVEDLYDILPQTTILGNLLEDLMKWVNSYLSVAAPHLNFLMYGTDEFKRILGDLINFFKPYHARMLSYDVAFVNDDRNTESVIVDDFPIDSIEEVMLDWDTCNSQPCCNDTCTNPSPSSFYSRATYDCGSFYDIGGACDGREGSFITEIEEHIPDKLTCQSGFTDLTEYNNPTSPLYKHDPYVENETEDIPVEYLEAHSGNFISFDEGGYFDNHYATDVCMVQVIG